MLGERIKALTDSIYESVGYEFNINSPKQLGVALLKSLNYRARKRQKQDIQPMPRYLKA